MSRTRSAVTSRSNCAKEKQHVQRQPAHRGGGVEGLGHRDEGDPGGVEDRDDAGEVGQRPGQPVDLVDDHDIDAAGRHVGQQLAQAGAVHRAAGEAAVVVAAGQGGPALVLLAQDVGRAGLALRVERVERLLQPLLGALAGVDRAAALRRRARHHGASPSRRPKKAGPLRRVPVISRAIGRERGPALAAPQIAGLGDLHLVLLRLPDPDQPAAGPEPLLATVGARSASVQRSAGSPPRAPRAAARPIARSRRAARPATSRRCRASAAAAAPPSAAVRPRPRTRPAAGRRSTGRAGRRSAPPAPRQAAARHPRRRSRSSSASIRPPGPGDRPCASPSSRSARRSRAGGAG